jgi:UDP-N-acetylglucosamine acyltransferase
MIHSTAIIHSSARLGRDLHIGAYAVIDAEVEIGDGCEIGHHAVIEGPTRLGRDNRIFPHACLGMAPQDIGYRGEPTRLEIGERNVIREFVTLHRASTKEQWVTRVGNDNLFMVSSHVAHDCIVGDHVIMANAATLAGHVTVGDYVNISGLCAVHQFVRIGASVMLGGGTMVPLDIAPFVMAHGNPAKLYGLNLRGLQRRGFSMAEIRQLKRAYKLLFHSELRLEEAMAAVQAEEGLDSPHVAYLLDFLRTSKRGVNR